MRRIFLNNSPRFSTRVLSALILIFIRSPSFAFSLTIANSFPLSASVVFLRQIANAGTGIGYRGCTRKLTLNGRDLSLKYPGPDVKEQRNVAPNCGKSPCTSVPCLNGAACIVTSANTYRCQCQLGFKGRTCNERGN